MSSLADTSLMARWRSLYGRQGTAAQTGRIERDAALAQTPESAVGGEEGRRSRSRAGRIVVEADVTLGPLRKSQPSAGNSIFVSLLLKRSIGTATITTSTCSTAGGYIHISGGIGIASIAVGDGVR